MYGFFKVSHGITRKPWFTFPNTVQVWVWILDRANYTEGGFLGQTVHIGEVATSYGTIARETNLSVSQVRTAINHLKQNGDITTRPYNKFQIIKVTEYSHVNAPRAEKPTKTKYQDYMQTAAWREKRSERLEMDGYCCALCGDKNDLEVHHLTYDRLGNESMEDLITVCHSCHEMLHGRKWNSGNKKSVVETDTATQWLPAYRAVAEYIKENREHFTDATNDVWGRIDITPQGEVVLINRQILSEELWRNGYDFDKIKKDFRDNSVLILNTQQHYFHFTRCHKVKGYYVKLRMSRSLGVA